MLNAFLRYIYEESPLYTKQPVFTDWLIEDNFLPENLKSGVYKPAPVAHPVPVDHSGPSRAVGLENAKLTPMVRNIIVVCCVMLCRVTVEILDLLIFFVTIKINFQGWTASNS